MGFVRYTAVFLVATLAAFSTLHAQSEPVACSIAGNTGTSYMDASISDLKKAVPALRSLKADTPSADQTTAILTKTGAAIALMLPKIPDLSANETLSQALIPLPLTLSENTADSSVSARAGVSPSGRLGASQIATSTQHTAGTDEIQRALHTILTTPANFHSFNYRIIATPDPKLGAVIDEYRTDAKNQPTSLADPIPGHPDSVGFGTSWLFLVPSNQPQSRFRYLGHQKIGKHDTVVLAFAQTPEKVAMPARIQSSAASCPFFTQGVVWIDQATDELVRMETYLLAPLPGIGLDQLHSVLNFTEVKIPQRNLTLYLPSDVEINWEATSRAGGELHTYTNYHLFGTTSTIKLDNPN